MRMEDKQISRSEIGTKKVIKNGFLKGCNRGIWIFQDL